MEPNILDKINHKTGMTVPDGFFEDFNRRMAESLPVQEWERPKILPRTTWQKIRPYVYMAAMFLGIWCMMNMFNFFHPASRLDIANNPELMAAINNDNFYFDYCYNETSSADNADLYDDLYDQGFDPSEIQFDTNL